MTQQALTTSQINTLTQHLKQQQQEIAAQLEQSSETADPVTLDQQSVGRLSRMDAMQHQQMALANRAQLTLLHKQTSAALARVQAHEYGLCLNCAEVIAFARLQAQPHTPYCLACQSALEKQ